MIKKLLKKQYTYFFIASIFATFEFRTYVLIKNDVYNNFIESLEGWFYFLLVYLPFVISLLTSLIIEKKQNKYNQKKLFLCECVINLILFLFMIVYYFLIYVGSNMFSTPS